MSLYYPLQNVYFYHGLKYFSYRYSERIQQRMYIDYNFKLNLKMMLFLLLCLAAQMGSDIKLTDIKQLSSAQSANLC